MLTHADSLARLLVPAVASLVPPAALDRERRTEYALTREGKIEPHALLLSGSLVIAGLCDLNVTSTASTVTYATATQKLNLDLPAGIWSVMAMAMATAGNTLSSTVDMRLVIAGIENPNPPRITGSTSNLSAIQDLFRVSDIAGDQVLTVEWQCKVGSGGSGTSSIRDVVVVVLAWRQS